jgi:hypothetical protein
MPEDREGAIWRLLRDRAADDRAAGDNALPDDGPASPGSRRESWVPVLDAVLGVLAATRHLVEVTEDVVREQRDRMASATGASGMTETSRTTSAERKKIDLSY